MSRKLNNWFVVLAFAMTLIPGCVVRPPNIATTATANAYGLTYSGKLLQIKPIFFTGSVARYTATNGAIGGLAADMLFMDNQYQFQMNTIGSSFSSALGGELEESERGAYCQYFVEMDNEEIATGIKSQLGATTVETYDPYAEMMRNQIDQRQYELNDMASRSPGEEFQMQIDTFQKELEKLRIDMNTPRDKEKSKDIVMAVNPCRDFKIGQSVVVTRTAAEIIIEHDWRSANNVAKGN